jgi:hypothetical protein
MMNRPDRSPTKGTTTPGALLKRSRDADPKIPSSRQPPLVTQLSQEPEHAPKTHGVADAAGAREIG